MQRSICSDTNAFLRYLQQADQAVRNGGTSAGLCGREIRSKRWESSAAVRSVS